MIWLLLLAQLFAFPVTNAYALQNGDDVVVSVTFTETIPTTVCVFVYELAEVMVKYPSGQIVKFQLTTKVNT